jgi:SAM-dependent methyltransferase
MLKFLSKVKHYINRKFFKNLKYDFEEFIPNSKAGSKDINELIKINVKNLTTNLVNINNFFNEAKVQNIESLKVNKEFQKRLRILFNNYGSDKNIHGYDVLYAKILKEISHNPTILEIGVGSNNISIPSNMGKKGFPGASLKVFSDIYPNSEIFGADIDKQILKNFKNVKMFYLDQNNLKTYNNDIINEKYFDLIIDDGLHMQSANLNTLIFALERLKPGGVLVIEDITISALNTWHIVKGLLREPFEFSLYKCFDNYAVTVELKKQIS